MENQSFVVALENDQSFSTSDALTWVPTEALKSRISRYHGYITSERAKRVHFTQPFLYVDELIVSSSKHKKIKDKNDFSGKSITYQTGTSFEENLIGLQAKVEQLSIKSTELELSHEAYIDKISKGEFEFGVIDSNLLKSINSYRNDIKTLYTLKKSQPIAWAVRKNNPFLLKSINKFLLRYQLTMTKDATYTGDWKQIRQKKVLRLITRNSPETYFMWRGELMGFEYELVKKIAQDNNLHLEVVVAPTHSELTDYLLQGKGDLIAAGLSVTDERQYFEEVEYSKPYSYVDELIVSHKDSPTLSRLEDLAGRTIVVRKSSAFWEHLQQLRKQGVRFELVAADESLTTEMLIEKVAIEEIDLTVADSHLISIEQNFRTKIIAPLTLKNEMPWGWLTRKNNPLLREKNNQFIKKEYRGLFYNVTKSKFFKNKKRLKKYTANRLTDLTKLSPYDHISKPLSKQYYFDWRLITAQMYQESRFNPKAKSFAGAMGLMQVLPRTADSLGFDKLTQPEQGLHAGVKYLHWVRERFDAKLPVQERLWMTLAAY